MATLTGRLEQVMQAARVLAEQRHTPGFLGEEVLLGTDGRTVVMPVFFASQDAYERLAREPDQDTWWREQMAPHLSDVRWIDGTWQQAVSRAALPVAVSAQPD